MVFRKFVRKQEQAIRRFKQHPLHWTYTINGDPFFIIPCTPTLTLLILETPLYPWSQILFNSSPNFFKWFITVSAIYTLVIRSRGNKPTNSSLIFLFFLKNLKKIASSSLLWLVTSSANTLQNFAFLISSIISLRIMSESIMSIISFWIVAKVYLAFTCDVLIHDFDIRYKDFGFSALSSVLISTSFSIFNDWSTSFSKRMTETSFRYYQHFIWDLLF